MQTYECCHFVSSSLFQGCHKTRLAFVPIQKSVCVIYLIKMTVKVRKESVYMISSLNMFRSELTELHTFQFYHCHAPVILQYKNCVIDGSFELILLHAKSFCL